MTELSDVERERYERQLALPGFDAGAQRLLAGAEVLVVGAGAHGCAAAGYLAAAGVGRTGILDRGTVALSDLPGQLVLRERDVGRNRAEAASFRLGALGPEGLVEPYPVALTVDNARPLASGRSAVIDCTGSEDVRAVLGDACRAERVALVTAAVSGFGGRLLTVEAESSPCNRCVLESVSVGRAEPGVAGPVAGAVGALQALEAIKLVTGLGTTLGGRVIDLDALRGRVTAAEVEPRPGCECGVPVPAGEAA